MTDKYIQRDDKVAASTPEAQHHREVLERAKARARQRSKPEDMTGTPRFDQVHEAGKSMRPAPGHDTPPPVLSQQTMDALDAIARANQPPPPPEDPAAVEERVRLNREDVADLFGINLSAAGKILEIAYPDKEQNTALRAVVEKRLKPIDIGEFLMNGVLSQTVPIIEQSEAVSTGLVITYQTVPDAVEALVDRLLSDEAARIRKVRDGDAFIDAEMTQREYVRRQNEYALAVHVSSYNSDRWRTLLKQDGGVDENALTSRLAKVRLLPSPILTFALQNLGWFLERVQSALEVSALGNG